MNFDNPNNNQDKNPTLMDQKEDKNDKKEGEYYEKYCIIIKKIRENVRRLLTGFKDLKDSEFSYQKMTNHFYNLFSRTYSTDKAEGISLEDLNSASMIDSSIFKKILEEINTGATPYYVIIDQKNNSRPTFSKIDLQNLLFCWVSIIHAQMILQKMSTDEKQLEVHQTARKNLPEDVQSKLKPLITKPQGEFIFKESMNLISSLGSKIQICHIDKEQKKILVELMNRIARDTTNNNPPIPISGVDNILIVPPMMTKESELSEDNHKLIALLYTLKHY